MKPLASAGLFRRHGWAFLSAGILVLLAAPLLAAPASKAAKSSGRQAVAPAPAPASSALRRGEHADALPSSEPAAPDLLLSVEDERKAQAFAAFGQAVLAEDSADADAALAGFRKALAFDPGYAELSVKVAYELAKRNDPSAGIQVLKDTIKAAPKEPLPLIYLSQLYLKNLRKPDLALKYAEQALALDVNYYPAYLALFELHLTGRQPEKAAALLARAAKSSSADPQFWVQIGELFARLHLKEDGQPSSPDALRQMSVVFRRAADLGKNNAAVVARAADYFVLSRQVKEAIPLYLRALTLPPGADDPPASDTREKLARALLATGQHDEAITALEQLTKDNPLQFATYELLGELYEKKGDLDKALTNYQQTVLLDASKPENHLRVADLARRAKQFDRAIETAQAARKRFPDDPRSVYLLAITFGQAKRHNEAMAAFAEAQTAFELGQAEAALDAQFYFSYGAAAEQAGVLDKAAEMLRRAIELEPEGEVAAQAYNYLGYMWVDRGEKLDEAGEMIKKAVAMEPDNGAFLDSLGWFYFKKGDYEKALKELLRAIEVTKPEDAVVYEHVGDTYAQLGRAADALRAWEKALALDNENKKLAEKIEGAKQKSAATLPREVKRVE